MFEKYETVVGLEVHVQLNTASKAFCADAANFGGEPNTHISAISLGYPGTLPRLNKRQIEYAVRLGLALGSEINLRSTFDRKNYFYADLPKGYQITQDRQPICIGGSLEIEVNGEKKVIRIHHIHMEEDAGKSIHDLSDYHSFIDLNRAGVPLLEIVSEPDLRSAEEVAVFMETMLNLVKWLGVSDGNMAEGSMRADCNVSVRLKGSKEYGQRCEIKNVNSMRFARRAVEFEAKRQVELVESGGKVTQQTLNFDPETGVTTPIRNKENAHDYRYFPDPDLPPIVLKKDFVEKVWAEIQPLPNDLKQKFVRECGIAKDDAIILTEDKSIALFYNEFIKVTKNYKSAANLTINKIRPFLAETNLEIGDFPLSIHQLSEFIDLIDADKVSNSVAYQKLFPALIENPSKTPTQLAEAMNLIQSSDNNFLEGLADEVIAKFPDKVAEYKKGKKGLIGMFMGELMKLSKGKANPKDATQILEKKLKD